jgi:hypothetical protein
VSRSAEERKIAEVPRAHGEDKWQSLKAYRRSKGLCFICGEKWNREHQCKKSVQLHVVQEMVDFMRALDDDPMSELTNNEPPVPQPQLMMLSLAALNPSISSAKAMQLQVEIQGQQFHFLVDSGSSTCFIDASRALSLSGRQTLTDPVHVKVVGGAILQCTNSSLVCNAQLLIRPLWISSECCLWTVMMASSALIG